MTADGDSLPYSQAMSSSEHLTTSERATSLLDPGAHASAPPMIVGRRWGRKRPWRSAGLADRVGHLGLARPQRRADRADVDVRGALGKGDWGRFQCRSNT